MAGQFDESEMIDVVEVSYRVVKVKQQKYVCRCGGCVETAPGPTRALNGSRYSLAFAIKVLIDKWLDHIPLERQVRILERHGLSVTSTTLWDLAYAVTQQLSRVDAALFDYTKAQPVIGLDQTGWPRLEAEGSKPWQMWCLCALALVSPVFLRPRDPIEDLLSQLLGILPLRRIAEANDLEAESISFFSQRHRTSAARARSQVRTGRGEDLRFLAPFGMVLYRHGLYVIVARDWRKPTPTLRHRRAMFAIDRFAGAEHLRARFAVPSGFNIREALHGAFGPHLVDAAGPYEVVVEFNREKVLLASSRTWHPTQKFEGLRNGNLRITLQLPHLAPVVSWILEWVRTRAQSLRSRSSQTSEPSFLERERNMEMSSDREAPRTYYQWVRRGWFHGVALKVIVVTNS